LASTDQNLFCMRTESDTLMALAREALALEWPGPGQNETERLRSQAKVLRELARRLGDRVGRPGPGKAKPSF